METVVILKKDIKFYYFTNYLLRNMPPETVDVIMTDVVSDDMGDIVWPVANSLSQDTASVKYNELLTLEQGLYISKGLSKFKAFFNDEELLLNFHKFIVVHDNKRIIDRMLSI
ncbi:MAG: hypothetical protein PSV16_14695 [Flavobacterium sp.]|nr:hypothetical protein [Flavobacterium sp.]